MLRNLQVGFGEILKAEVKTVSIVHALDPFADGLGSGGLVLLRVPGPFEENFSALVPHHDFLAAVLGFHLHAALVVEELEAAGGFEVEVECAALPGFPQVIEEIEIELQSTAALAQGKEEEKWAAFGWHAQRVDGNDLDAVVTAFDEARNTDHAGPRVIIFDTRMCKGVDFLESREITHFVRVEADEWSKALAKLEEGKPQ